MEQQPLIPSAPPRRTSTRSTYDTTLRIYDRFLATVGRERSDPAAVAGFLRYRATQGARMSTIRKDLHGIAAILVDSMHPDPRNSEEVKGMLKSLYAEVPTPAKEPKAAILTGGIRAAIKALSAPRKRKRSPGEDLRALRDAALLLMTFAGALKRDEARTLLVENVMFTADGMVLVVNSSDDERAARRVEIARGKNAMTDSITAYQRYVKAAGVTDGYAFRPISPDGHVSAGPIKPTYFTMLIKERLRAVGLSGNLLSPMAIRRGTAAMASAEGATLEEVAEITGHADATHIRPLHLRARAVGKRARDLLAL